jgi:hypothetical protein
MILFLIFAVWLGYDFFRMMKDQKAGALDRQIAADLFIAAPRDLGKLIIKLVKKLLKKV